MGFENKKEKGKKPPSSLLDQRSAQNPKPPLQRAGPPPHPAQLRPASARATAAPHLALSLADKASPPVSHPLSRSLAPSDQATPRVSCFVVRPPSPRRSHLRPSPPSSPLPSCRTGKYGTAPSSSP